MLPNNLKSLSAWESRLSMDLNAPDAALILSCEKMFFARESKDVFGVVGSLTVKIVAPLQNHNLFRRARELGSSIHASAEIDDLNIGAEIEVTHRLIA